MLVCLISCGVSCVSTPKIYRASLMGKSTFETELEIILHVRAGPVINTTRETLTLIKSTTWVLPTSFFSVIALTAAEDKERVVLISQKFSATSGLWSQAPGPSPNAAIFGAEHRVERRSLALLCTERRVPTCVELGGLGFPPHRCYLPQSFLFVFVFQRPWSRRTTL